MPEELNEYLNGDAFKSFKLPEFITLLRVPFCKTCPAKDVTAMWTGVREGNTSMIKTYFQYKAPEDVASRIRDAGIELSREEASELRVLALHEQVRDTTTAGPLKVACTTLGIALEAPRKDRALVAAEKKLEKREKAKKRKPAGAG